MTLTLNSTQCFVTVAVDVPSLEFLEYRIPEALHQAAAVGKRVSIPLGRRKTQGVITELKVQANFPKIKDVLDVLDEQPLFSAKFLEFASWVSEYYLCTLASVLFSALPPDLKEALDFYDDELLEFVDASSWLEDWFLENTRKKKATELVQFMSTQGVFSVQGLREAFPKFASLRGFVQGFFDLNRVRIRGSRIGVRDDGLGLGHGQGASLDPGSGSRMTTEASEVTSIPQLTEHQAQAVASIEQALAEKAFSCKLLHGVTGSGKTEVYMRAVAKVLEAGQSALVLVPEIALTPQLTRIFKQRFGSQVAVLHSQLSASQRSQYWWRIKQGRLPIVIGARSAIFAPLENLGLIVVDEEHEQSYKQDDTPRYQGRDIAVVRAQKLGIPIILGSATPSIESFDNVQKGKYQLISMPERAGQAQMPQMFCIDMRYDPRKTALLSRFLFEQIIKTLQKQEQTILFLNRRGGSPTVLCEACGQTVRCMRCDVSMTHHLKTGKLHCHYCDAKQLVPKQCPHCQSSKLEMIGVGTQKLEAHIQKLFPQAVVERIDTDVASRKGAVEDILERMRTGKVDILIGTQMIAKGLDFENVTLIGVIAADAGLAVPDFRSAERSFQLISQVAGRAGRSLKKGHVVLQSYNPDHFALKLALHNDYQGFFDQEQNLRSKLAYPPYSRLVQILLRGKNLEVVERTARSLSFVLEKAGVAELAQVLGPAPMSIAYIHHQHRWHILLKSHKPGQLKAFLAQRLSQFKLPAGVKVHLNVDPSGMI